MWAKLGSEADVGFSRHCKVLDKSHHVCSIVRLIAVGEMLMGYQVGCLWNQPWSRYHRKQDSQKQREFWPLRPFLNPLLFGPPNVFGPPIMVKSSFHTCPPVLAKMWRLVGCSIFSKYFKSTVYSFENMYSMLQAKVDRLAGKFNLVQKEAQKHNFYHLRTTLKFGGVWDCLAFL